MTNKTLSYDDLVRTLTGLARKRRTPVDRISPVAMISAVTGLTERDVRNKCSDSRKQPKNNLDYSDVPQLVETFSQANGTAPSYQDMRKLLQRQSAGNVHTIVTKAVARNLVRLDTSSRVVRIELPLTRT